MYNSFYRILHSIEEIKHDQFDCQEQKGHHGSGLGIIHGPIATRPHDQGVDLMGRQNKGIGGRQPDNQGGHSWITAGHEGQVHTEGHQQNGSPDIGDDQGEK